MSATEPVGIRALATYLPAGRMSAAEIAAATRGQWSAEAIREKLGIESKTTAGPGDGSQEMGAIAAARCLELAGLDPARLDAIICIGDELREYPMTTSGIYIQQRIGARNAWAVDLMVKCSTFAAGIRMALALLRSDSATRTVLLAGGYRNGDLIDYTNPRLSFMFNLAPGGGAVLLERGWSENEVLGAALLTDGDFARHVLAPAGGTVCPLPTSPHAGHCLEVVAQEEMRRLLAERSLPNFLKVASQALEQGGLGVADIDYLALLHMKRSAHQELLRELGLREEQSRYLSHIGHVGQFDQLISLEAGLAAGQVRAGSVVLALGAGIGYSWGSVALRWGPVRAMGHATFKHRKTGVQAC